MAGSSTVFVILKRAYAVAASASTSKLEAAATTGKTRRKKNLIEVVQFLPKWGVGAKLAKTHWHPSTFYQIERIQLYKDAKHGAAWGIFYESGVPQSGTIEKVGGVNKRCWRYLKEEQKTWKMLEI